MEQDALLAELNGALAKVGDPKFIDPPPPAAPTLRDQLETAPSAHRSKPTAASLADKAHAKSVGGYGYRVIVEGEYYAKSTETKGHAIKKYELPFNLPSLQNAKGESALGIIVGKLLKDALKKMDPHAETYRTHAIKSVTPLQGAPEPTSLQYMSVDALREYAKRELVPAGFPVDPDSYWDVESLREDVIDFKTNFTTDIVNGQTGEKTKGGLGLKKSAAERILERHAERVEKRELALMNE